MSSSVRFSETRLQQEPHRLRLIGPGNQVLLTVVGHEIDDAVRAGFLDRNNFHFSMYEYAKLRTLTPLAQASAEPACETAPPADANADFDRRFLGELNIAWE